MIIDRHIDPYEEALLDYTSCEAYTVAVDGLFLMLEMALTIMQVATRSIQLYVGHKQSTLDTGYTIILAIHT